MTVPPRKSIESLLVEDDERSAQRLSRLLAHAGHTVHIADDGVSALVELASRRPDVVLLDLMMPDMDGADTLAQLRANPALADLPVIVLSALTSGPLVDAVPALGIDAFHVKGTAYFQSLLLRLSEMAAGRPEMAAETGRSPA